MTNKDKQEITFWEFLNEHKIEIPVIQRDYAQGRRGKEKLREKFLHDLKKALDIDTRVSLKLDFVYGSIENDSINPLDGQQRLTTLWLLHWYIAYKAGKLIENKEIFKRFSYETRVSSREFLIKLSEFAEIQSEVENIVDHIKNQTWFFSAWNQDPTIQAMLNMLGGTGINGKNGEVFDGIEKLFGGLTQQSYSDYWEGLTNENCPIIFYYMSLNELKLSDDLYIKMNARGKSLTSFENFKADLIGFVKHKTENGEWTTFDIDDIGLKLDTIWTDLFWNFKSLKNEIDEIYFAFFNQYFLNQLITAKKTNSEPDYIFFVEELYKDQNNQHQTFKYLNSDIIDYTSINVYFPKNKDDGDLFSQSVIERLSNILNNISDSDIKNINKMFYPFGVSDFRFIPEYDDKGILRTLTNMRSRVVFHAICCYFENNKYNDGILFQQWMRVVWNLTENMNIDNAQTMISAMRLIDELGLHSNDIYNFLGEVNVDTGNFNNKITSGFATDQITEEREKAKQIINDKTNYWEGKIIEAENTAFFKGAIRFMLNKEKEKYDWGFFKDRLAKSKEYFDDKGVKDNYKVDITTALVKSLKDWNDQLCWEKYIFNTNAETWKNILTKKEYNFPVSMILDSPNLSSVSIIDFVGEGPDIVKKQLLEDGVIEYLVKHNYWKSSRFRWSYDRPCLYPPYGRLFILFDWENNSSNKSLKKLMDKGVVSINDDQKIPGNNSLFIGNDFFIKKVGDVEYYWRDKLIKRELKNDSFKDEEIIVDSSGNNITLDTLEDYLTTL